MTTASAVAQHLIRLAAVGPESEPMTAMKLHKLLYYCQGWHLAWYGQALFAERIEAWKHGPVLPQVQNQPWVTGSQPLADPKLPVELNARERSFTEQVWSHYHKFSAWGLREKSHAENPWRKHYKPDAEGRCSEEIPIGELKDFFGKEFQKETGEEAGAWSDPSPDQLVPLGSLERRLGW